MKRVKNFNYRHIICILITTAFVLCNIFLFPYSVHRIIESIKDFGLSIAYYFLELLEIGNGLVIPTVNSFSAQPFTMPFNLPETWEEFLILWDNYWVKWASSENFYGYIEYLNNVAYDLCKIFLLVMPFMLLVFMLFDRYLSIENNKYNEDSKPLKIFKNISSAVYAPIKKWLISFFMFLRENNFYVKIWIFIWAINFNLITIVLEFIAYYLYLVISFDFASIYVQVLKLLMDLSIMIDFVPLLIWIIIGLVIFHSIRKNIALKSLNHKERKNRGFINSRPIVIMVCGTMGKKKTTMVTDMALSQEVMLRDKAFEKILENDLKFPFFPWINLENVMKIQMAKHTVYNLATTKKFIRTLKYFYDTCNEYPEYKRCFRKHLKRRFGFYFDNMLFDYDYKRYGLTYDDKLKVVDVWDVIETYAQLYFIYTIQSSYILSNYSIRTDNLISDLGNFPLWNTDFFESDSRLIDSYSRHAHILDFDMLRLGKKVIEDNKNANAFEFGVVVITEIGKERGNNLENIEKKKSDETANQKNDKFNNWVKMIRHSSTVDFFPFVKVIVDEQRPASWGADAKDMCDIVYIDESNEQQLAMPFFTVEELLYQFFFSRFSNLYYKYRYIRSDNTLPMYLLKKITAIINNYYVGIYNRFGFNMLQVLVQNGTMDGEKIICKYYLTKKKILSKRFSTDCYSDFFIEKALRSKVGLNDLIEFKTEKATLEELIYENAYFMQDILADFNNKME